MQRSWVRMAPTRDSTLALLLGFALVVVGGASAVLMASNAGWPVCAVLGVLLLAASLSVPLGKSAGFLRVAVGTFGIVALVLAVGEVMTG